MDDTGNLTVNPEKKPAGTGPSAMLMFAGYALGGTGIFLGFGAENSSQALSWVVLFSVGALGVVSFVRHALFHRSDAARMGWDLGRRNNFQVEVGMANLAWGLTAFACVVWDWGLAAQAAVTFTFSLYLFQGAILHVVSILSADEQRSGKGAWTAVSATLLLATLLCYFAVAALHEAGVSPF